MQLIPRVATLIGALFVPGSAAAAQQIAFPPPVEVRIPKPPTITHGGGQSVLPYELHVTNFSRQPLTLQRIEVLNAESGASLVTLVDSALARSIARPAAQIPMAERAHIGPGLRTVVYMWVPLGNAIATPRTVRHRLTLVSDSVNAAPLMLETPAVAVTSNVLVIAPPLRGGVWLAANGPAAESGHRRALIPVEAGMFIAQRFAIDWVKVDEQGRTFSGDSLKNTSYYAYGSDALAVADGVVSEVKDSIPQNVPGATSRAVPITLETVGGNHVIVDIGGGHFAFYAHLQPGSIKVHVGDRVKRGQLLGLVGNSGNSTEPHLHFHISDASSPLGSEGIPYVFDTLEIVGHCRTFNLDCVRTAPITEHREMPMANELVRFP